MEVKKYRMRRRPKAVREFEKRKERQYIQGMLDQQVKTWNGEEVTGFICPHTHSVLYVGQY